jgi:hypothetical protein
MSRIASPTMSIVTFLISAVVTAVTALSVWQPVFEENVELLFVFLMVYTVLIIVALASVIPYEYYPKDVVGENTSSTTLIQIDAAVMIGALFFLQVVPFSEDTADGEPKSRTGSEIPPIRFGELNNLTSSQQRILLATLTALSIIPFAISAILIAAWGKLRFWHKRVTELRGVDHRGDPVTYKSEPEGVTGTMVGATFMIAGFVWVIVTMIILVYIIR